MAVVNSYMAHHQGMALVAIGNVLHGSAMVRRFHAEPMVQATELLLQERMPRDVLVARLRADEVKSDADVRDLVPPVLRRFTSPERPDAAHPCAVQRPLRGHGHRSRVGPKPLAGPRRLALA